MPQCVKTISTTDTLIVCSFDTTSQTDGNTKDRSKYDSLYIHFQEKCFKNFDTEKFYRPRESFNFSSIIADKDTSDSLKVSEKAFFAQLGLNFP